ncbi:MAG: 16S rRNA (cytosine(1402)-N(4))-methyltransferase RsmH [Chitinophagales bacterium]|nr:16S rRNA (cytosine(1402)-N(4))-methyltransferase RsmH [Hyphomicrobiales bacterium]
MTDGGGIEGSLPPSGPVRHTPVLLPEMLSALQPKDGGRYIDCTFGAGGYTRALLEAADCHVLALDRDPNAIAAGQDLIQHFGDRLTLVEGRFGELGDIAEARGFYPADGVVFDLGVSSMQLDEAERGFSFMRDGPLDMRMSAQGVSAADVVNAFEQDAIANILYQFGEERRSRAIARTIVAARAEKPFERTSELAALCLRVLGQKPGDKNPATRTFQALRLYVNDELGEVTRGLEAAESILQSGGRLVMVTFHSLDDRIAKQFLHDRAGRIAAPSRHAPAAEKQAAPTFRLLTRKPVEPSEAEIAANPRARSAKLRAAEKLHPPTV